MHMTLILVMRPGENIEALMNPFWQDLEVQPTWGEPITSEEKQKFLNYYKEQGMIKSSNLKYFESAYAKYGEKWNFNTWRKKLSDGEWYEWITWNKNQKWDWFEIGGRWPGRLILKEGAESKPQINFSWGWSEEDRKKFNKEHPRATDIALKKDIANWDELTTYSLLIDGEWYDSWDLGLAQQDKAIKVSDHLKNIPDDAEIVCIDYHM